MGPLHLRVSKFVELEAATVHCVFILKVRMLHDSMNRIFANSFPRNYSFLKGNIHVLRKHKGGREGVSQMLMFAYVGGCGAKGLCIRNHSMEKNAE